MAVCNLFKPLTKTTGTFFTFSQYTDDLTRFASDHNSYVVEPSKFMVFDFDYSNINHYNTNDSETDKNYWISEWLQNYMENGCAYIKSTASDSSGIVWSPAYATNLLWKTFIDAGLMHMVTEPASSGAGTYIQELKYIGTIDIQSYNEVEGMGYSEVYCHIPNDSKETRHYFTYSADNTQLTDQKGYIEGWTREELDNGDTIKGILTNPTTYEYKHSLTDNGYKVQSSGSYKFNTVLVLYNIVSIDSNGNHVVKYSDVPYGIYFTGTIDGTGEMSNYVTKYSYNADTYGEGTSYGLRICSKYITLPSGSLVPHDIDISTENYSAFSQAMAKMAESQQKMDDVLSKLNEYVNTITNQLAEFRTYRTNVPYIKTINGEDYWFVNGRNTGSKACNHGLMHGYGNSTTDGIDQKFLTEKLAELEESLYKKTLRFTANQSVFDKSSTDPVSVVFNWGIYKGDELIDVSDIVSLSVYVSQDGGKTYTPSKNLEVAPSGTFTMSGIVKEMKVKLVAVITSKTMESTIDISFASRSYYGYIETPDSAPTSFDHTKLTSIFKSGKSLWENLNPNYNSIQIMYPKQFGAAVSIWDPVNNLEYLNDFYVNDSYKIGEEYYYVYTAKDPAAATNFKLQFK